MKSTYISRFVSKIDNCVLFLTILKVDKRCHFTRTKNVIFSFDKAIIEAPCRCFWRTQSFSIMSSKEYFPWSDETKYRLAYIVQKHSAHKKSEISMKDKWQNVLNELKGIAAFSTLSITSDALKNAYKRQGELVLKELGISDDSANLSGLKPISDYQKLVVDLATEVYDQQQAVKSANSKKAKIKEGVLKHESAGLAAQGVAAFTPQVKVEKDEQQSSAGSNITSTSSPRGSWFDLQKKMIDLTEDEEDVELERAEKRQKLRHDEEEHAMRMQERAASLEMQKALLALISKHK